MIRFLYGWWLVVFMTEFLAYTIQALLNLLNITKCDNIVSANGIPEKAHLLFTGESLSVSELVRLFLTAFYGNMDMR
ncbi:hypothetical protein B9475_002510 [Proteus mirabilis]|nr:hypothetical protein B9475_002510 [Proteus mirabilis]